MAGRPPSHAQAYLLAAVLAAGALGCGPGLTVRGRGATSIAPREIASAGIGTPAGMRAGMPGGAAGPVASTATAATWTDGEATSATAELLDGDHNDDLPPLPPAASLDPDGINGLAPASHAAGTPAATRYAAMDRTTCEGELGKRKIAFERVGETRGVIAPVRLRGAIAGVDFHSMLPRAQRRTSPYEIYDCRLVLALDDWARVLARHDVVEVVHYSVYRPPPKKRVLRGAGRRHTGALAIDAAIFKTRDGQTMSVLKDFHGRIGSKPCGASAAATRRLPASAVTLREIVCEAADAQLFNVLLTPDYNRPHRNHFHLEVTAGVRWVLVR